MTSDQPVGRSPEGTENDLRAAADRIVTLQAARDAAYERKDVTDGWEMQEAGWWTHPVFGGIVKEGARWFLYPLCPNTNTSCWPTLRAAMREVRLIQRSRDCIREAPHD